MTVALVNTGSYLGSVCCHSSDESPASSETSTKTMPMIILFWIGRSQKRGGILWLGSLPNTVYKQILLSIFSDVELS